MTVMWKGLDRILNRLAFFFRSQSLKVKMIVLAVLISLLFLAGYFIGYEIIASSYNNMLYQSIAGSLKYSANDISQKLSSVESLSSSINSNKEVRKNLIILEDDENEIRRKNAKNSLTYLITDFHHGIRSSNVRNISIYTPKSGDIVSSHPGRGEQIPSAVYERILRISEQGDGYPVWITDYGNEYGLFIARDCRRVNNHNYERIGTLIIQIDLNKLVNVSTHSLLFSEPARFVISDRNRLIYKSQELSDDFALATLPSTRPNYGLVRMDRDDFFYIDGEFENFSWQYKCLIPYESIAKSIGFSRVLYFFVVLVALATAFFFANLISNSISVQFRALVEKMESFGTSDSVYKPIQESESSGRFDEIGQLQYHFERMAIRIQQLIRENFLNEILSKDAKLKALENQINPHFLYNTLESVNWRAKAIQATEISAIAESLGALLRITLRKIETNFILKDELDIVRYYITIQRIRFEERLIYREMVDPALLNVRFPKLTIQPLIENSITYAMEQNVEACLIELTAYRDGDEVVIEVENTGSQFADGLLQKLADQTVVPKGFGIGLLNIEKRLKLMYGPSYGLTLFNRDADHAVAKIHIPFQG